MKKQKSIRAKKAITINRVSTQEQAKEERSIKGKLGKGQYPG